MSAPAVSYFVPAYNAAPWIAEALGSITRQEGIEDYEVVIVDDGSTDATAAAVEPFLRDARFRYHRLGVNCGPGRSFLYGLSQCRGEFICGLAADDRLLPAHTAPRLELMRRHPQASIAGTSNVYIDAAGAPLEREIYHYGLPEYTDGAAALPILIQSNILTGSGVILRASVTRMVLPFMAGRWRYANDWLWYILHLATGFGLAWDGSQTVEYRETPGSLSRRPELEGARHAEFCLVPLFGLSVASGFSLDAAMLWVRHRKDLYARWLHCAYRLRRDGLLRPEWHDMAVAAYYRGAGGSRHLPLEWARHGLRMLDHRRRSLAIGRRLVLGGNGLKTVDHPLFRGRPLSEAR